MNLSAPLLAPARLLHSVRVRIRRLLPRQRSHTFGPSARSAPHRIERIYVINLDRQPDRWTEVTRELAQLLDSSGAQLTARTQRFPAFDGRSVTPPSDEVEVEPFYTLWDQLFVEPQPRALPQGLELERPIRMTQSEVAVARSHIGVWREIAAGNDAYALVLEDDASFHRGFARHLDQAWTEMGGVGNDAELFDLLYLSYKEVRGGAQKTFLSRSVFRPMRGLWYLSGYVLSQKGAVKLLSLLPCRGPADLWINLQFNALDVRATRRSLIGQRYDGLSSNSYSVLPVLTKIGVLDSGGESLFHMRPQERPVFAFGPKGSGLSSLAMALSMLGYRCCSDLQELPSAECERLLVGRSDRVFDAYINIGSLRSKARMLAELYPEARFIVTTSHDGSSDADHLEGVNGRNIAVLPAECANKWKVICEHLRCPPPACAFPEIPEIGQRRLLDKDVQPAPIATCKSAKRDKSPWVVEPQRKWRGIRLSPIGKPSTAIEAEVCSDSLLERLDTNRWFLRDDTFPGNLALFRRSNVKLDVGIGAVLSVKKEALGVRDYSAGSISSVDRYLFGRFEAELQATNVSGIVTGFFLHRDSPRQEIDIEIVGKRSDRLLVNVFYNPGCAGANFDYGYRGSPSIVELGFDASEALHRYAIEWSPSHIRWLVDNKVVHERANWDPTPIPHLPMGLHVNAWPSRSRELAGRLAKGRLPASTLVRSISVEARQV